MLGSLIPILTQLINLIPNGNQKAELLGKLQEAELEIAKGQLEVNAEEAKSSNWFVAGWRPAVGWVCVAGFTYNIVQPLFGWPRADLDQLMAILAAMLGIGGLRTFEKLKGVTR